MAESSNSSVLPVPSRDALTDILREAPSGCWPRRSKPKSADGSRHADLKDESAIVRWFAMAICRRATITTGVGPIEVQQPRVRDRRSPDEAEPFSSKVLPPYLRKTKSVEELIPWLYLKGISTGDFSEALASLLGPQATGLSASTVVRLKAVWEEEFQAWNKRSLEGKEYVYVWADGVHFNIRLEEDRQCILVLMGATADGSKELIAVLDGFRESEQSWKELLLDVKIAGPGRRSEAGDR